MSVVLDGRLYEIPGVTTISWLDDPRHVKETSFRRPREYPVEFIVLHSTGEHAVQEVTSGSRNPSNPFQWAEANARESQAHTASWDATMRSDGVLLWHNDPVRYEDYHATAMNPRSMGIEIAQSPEIFKIQVDAMVRVLDFLTAYFGIQRQIPWNNGVPDRRVMSRFVTGGSGYSGIVGHRNGDDNRSDPGDGVFVALKSAGYEGFDLASGEDHRIWSQRQRALGVPVTGMSDAATRSALAARGYPSGLWVKRGSSLGKTLAVAGLVTVAFGSLYYAARANPRSSLVRGWWVE